MLRRSQGSDLLLCFNHFNYLLVFNRLHNAVFHFLSVDNVAFRINKLVNYMFNVLVSQFLFKSLILAL